MPIQFAQSGFKPYVLPIWLFALLTFAGLLVVFAQTLNPQTKALHALLFARGEETVGTVTRMMSGRTGSRGGRYYTVWYRFTANGKQYEDSHDPGRWIYAKLHEGGPIDIVYLPTDPRRSTIGPRERLEQDEFGAYLGWTLAGIGTLGMCVAGLLRHRHDTRKMVPPLG